MHALCLVQVPQQLESVVPDRAAVSFDAVNQTDLLTQEDYSNGD